MARNVGNGNVERVRVGPFKDWLNQRHAYWMSQHHGQHDKSLGPSELLCGEVGWPLGTSGTKRLWRYRNGVADKKRRVGGEMVIRGSRVMFRGGHKQGYTAPADSFSRESVEDALHHAGVNFYSLYPEYAHERDAELPEDIFCDECREWVTPIDGECPWLTAHDLEEAA